MVRKSEQEKLEELNRKLEQINVKKQKLQAQINQKERKERTRILIQIGAIFSKEFDVHSVEDAMKKVQILKDGNASNI